VHARKAHKSQSSLSWKFQRAHSAQVAKFFVVEVSTRAKAHKSQSSLSWKFQRAQGSFVVELSTRPPPSPPRSLSPSLNGASPPRPAHTNPPHPGHGHADGRAGGPPAARTRRLRAGATAPIRALVRGARRELIGARALYERASSHALTRSSLRRRRRALAAASAAALALATAAQRARAGRPGVPRPTPTSRCCAPSGPPRATRPPPPKVPRPRRPPRARPPRALISVLILLI